VLCGVRHGNLAAIQTLAETVTRENYSLLITEAILLNFQLKEHMAVPEKSQRDKAYVTMTSMACLAAIPGTCDRTQELRKATVKSLLSHLDEILLCIEYTIGLPTTLADEFLIGDLSFPTTQLFESLVALDRDLALSIFSSETALGILFDLWLGQKKDFDPTFKFFNGYDGRSISFLMSTFTRDDDGLRAVVEQLLMSPKMLTLFTLQLLHRLGLIRGMASHRVPTAFVFGEYKALTRTLLRVTEHPILEARMRKKGYLQQWSSVCLDLAPTMQKDHVYFLLQPIYAQAEENPAIMVDVINSGVAKLLFQLISQREKPTPVDPPEWVTTVIETLRAFSFFHRTIEALAPLAKDFPSDCVARAGRSQSLVKAWTSLWGGGLFRAHVYDMVKTGGIGSSIVCDNYLVSAWSSCQNRLILLLAARRGPHPLGDESLCGMPHYGILQHRVPKGGLGDSSSSRMPGHVSYIPG
jgi:hypothetical protein